MRSASRALCSVCSAWRLHLCNDGGGCLRPLPILKFCEEGHVDCVELPRRVRFDQAAICDDRGRRGQRNRFYKICVAFAGRASKGIGRGQQQRRGTLRSEEIGQRLDEHLVAERLLRLCRRKQKGEHAPYFVERGRRARIIGGSVRSHHE
eukprot:scaffold161402_cov30-Tisochrysis_lutea.AAC.4